MALILVLLILVVGGAAALFSQADRSAMAAAAAYRRWQDHVQSKLGVAEVVHGGSHVVGANVASGQLAVVESSGVGRWFDFGQVAAVELTPIYDQLDEQTSRTTTSRGSQLIAAGVGATLAGPAGLVVGGLSAGSTTTARGISRDMLAGMELKLRLLDDQIPALKLLVTAPYDDVERLAARLENAIEERRESPKSSGTPIHSFKVDPAPQLTRGWWQRTFG